jgi:hypothetical protein
MSPYDNWKFNYCLKINQAAKRAKLASAKTYSKYSWDEAVKFLKCDPPRHIQRVRLDNGDIGYLFKDLLKYKLEQS